MERPVEGSMTSSVVCVMFVGFIIAVSFLVGVGSDLAPLPSTRSPGKTPDAQLGRLLRP
jgi:hypothetical protein